MTANSDYLHEAMDRVHIVRSIIDEHLSEHPGIVDAGRDWQVAGIMFDLFNIYQALGAAIVEAEDE